VDVNLPYHEGRLPTHGHTAIEAAMQAFAKRAAWVVQKRRPYPKNKAIPRRAIGRGSTIAHGINNSVAC
jgi:hypothetical protein